MHRFVIRVVKVLNPYCSIRIYFNYFFFDEVFTSFFMRTSSSLNIHPLIFEYELIYIQRTTTIVCFLNRHIHSVHHLYVMLIRILFLIPYKFYLTIDLTFFRIVLIAVILIHILIISIEFFLISIKESILSYTFPTSRLTTFLCHDSQFTTNDRVTYPVDELAILSIGDFGIIHIERTHCYGLRSSILCMSFVIIRTTHYESSTWHKCHPIRFRLFPLPSFYTYKLSSVIT